MLEHWQQAAAIAAGMGVGFATVVCGAVIVFALFVLNIFIAAKKGSASYKITLAIHLIALAVIAGNVLRIMSIETGIVILGNAVAFCCVLYSLWRQISERRTKQK